MISDISAKLIHALRHQKLSQDIAFSLGSFCILALSGIIINVVISSQRDVAALGVFNIAYAVYILASQFAVWGIHYSVLRHSALYEKNESERGVMIITAVFASIIMGLISSLFLTMADEIFVSIFDSENTGAAISNAALGLLIFPLNKVLLSYLNGLRMMKAFSMLQALRYLVVMAVVSFISASEISVDKITLCFIYAEAITAFAALIVIFQKRLIGKHKPSRKWLFQHYQFGTKGLAAGMFTEINSRIDVLMIGFFLSERETGIYSFAAMLVDGLYQVLSMVRLNFNPLLVSAIRDGNNELVIKLRKKFAIFVVPMIITLGIVLVIIYYLFAKFFMNSDDLLEGMMPLIVLLFGLSAISFLVPFDNLMMVSGYPGFQTMQQIITVAANIIVAALLLPIMGLVGAAAGTAASYLAGAGALIYFSQRIHGWNLITNKFRI